jgi:hypothetical protein
MHMLFPFKRVCASFVDLRPFGVISLEGDVETTNKTGRGISDTLLGNILENHIYEEMES